MSQALEISGVPHRRSRATGLGRLRDFLFGRRARTGSLPASKHLLRDIGLADELQSNPLLDDRHLFRR